MEVIEGIERLRRIKDRVGEDCPLSFPVATAEAVGKIEGVLPLSSELRLAYLRGAPCGSFPAFVQDSRLFSVDALNAAQVGYRVDISGAALVGWEPSWVVIGGDDGDPFIAHVNRPGTPVSVAVHGAGAWKPHVVADNLGDFYALVGAWVSLVVEDFEGSMLDEDRDFEVKAGFWAAFDRKLVRELPPHSAAGLRTYLRI